MGIFEAYAVILSYGNVANDPLFLVNNLIYNFGLIYDSLKDTITFFVDRPESKATSTFDVGFELG